MLNPKDFALEPGKLKKAPENFLSRDFATELTEKGMDDTRRGFLRHSFFGAMAAAAGGMTAPVRANQGEPAICKNKPGKPRLDSPSQQNLTACPRSTRPIYSGVNHLV